MKKKIHSATVLKAITIVYLVLSALGLPLYQHLPPIVNSIGARIHTYMAMYIAMGQTDPSAMTAFLFLCAMIYVLALIIFGVKAVMKERYLLYTILVALEIISTVVFFFILNRAIYEITTGMLINTIYCIWLLARVIRKRKTATIAD